MKRGSVYWINLEPSEPPELGKIRPGVVVSNTELNNQLSTVAIIPFSSQAPEIWPLRLKIQIPHQKVSFAVIPGIRQVNKLRCQERIAMMSEDQLAQIDEALGLYLRD